MTEVLRGEIQSRALAPSSSPDSPRCVYSDTKDDSGLLSKQLMDTGSPSVFSQRRLSPNPTLQ